MNETNIMVSLEIKKFAILCHGLEDNRIRFVSRSLKPIQNS